MERTVALKKLQGLLGKKMGWRINPKAPSSEDRQAAREAMTPAIAERNTLKEQCDARHRALLEGDAEYQRLNAARKAASENVERLSSVTRHFKITVGTSEGMFFMVKAEGDSWEEVLGKITAKKVAA